MTHNCRSNRGGVGNDLIRANLTSSSNFLSRIRVRVFLIHFIGGDQIKKIVSL